jgi:hypothetical protein
VSLHAHEIHDQTEHAHAPGTKGIGLTIAILAVLSAFVTMLMNHTSTEKVIVETKVADWWTYSHSNDSNARLYDVNARIAQLNAAGGAAIAAELRGERDRQRQDSDDARVMAQKLERDSAALTRKGNYYSSAELLLQLSVVLCSVAILTDLSVFWKGSFLSTAAGLLLAMIGMALR